MGARHTRKHMSSIRGQSTMHECACPAQVSKLLGRAPDPYAYQANCLNEADVDVCFHRNIAAATKAATRPSNNA
jgi:hypothetical protein